jgi:hypothetical protein
VTCWQSSVWSLWLPAQGAVLLDPLFTLPEVVLLMLFSTMTVLRETIQTTALALITAKVQSNGDVLREGKALARSVSAAGPYCLCLVIGELKMPQRDQQINPFDYCACLTMLRSKELPNERLAFLNFLCDICWAGFRGL